MDRTPPSPRSAKNLAEDIAALPPASAAEDTTSIVFVQAGAPARRARALDAVGRSAPAATAYDLGGGELAVLAPEALEHSVLRGLRGVRRDGVRWGVARWPLEGEDPALVLDLAASRAGRRSGPIAAVRWAVVAVAAALILALVLPAIRSDVRPIAAALEEVRGSTTGAAATVEEDREVRLLAPAVSSEEAPAVEGAVPTFVPPLVPPALPPAPPAQVSAGVAVRLPGTTTTVVSRSAGQARVATTSPAPPPTAASGPSPTPTAEPTPTAGPTPTNPPPTSSPTTAAPTASPATTTTTTAPPKKTTTTTTTTTAPPKKTTATTTSTSTTAPAERDAEDERDDEEREKVKRKDAETSE